MIINILEIQLQTVFYPGYSKRNITSVQAPVLGKKNVLADKSDNNVLYRIAGQIWQPLQYGMARPINGRATTIVFPFEGCGKKVTHCFYNIFLDVIFYPRLLQYFRVSKTIPALACLVALMIWHSSYRA